jgi:hypothetical protein
VRRAPTPIARPYPSTYSSRRSSRFTFYGVREAQSGEELVRDGTLGYPA